MAKDSGLNGYRNGAIFGFGIPKSTVLFGFQKRVFPRRDWISLRLYVLTFFFFFFWFLFSFLDTHFRSSCLTYQIDL